MWNNHKEEVQRSAHSRNLDYINTRSDSIFIELNWMNEQASVRITTTTKNEAIAHYLFLALHIITYIEFVSFLFTLIAIASWATYQTICRCAASIVQLRTIYRILFEMNE